MSWAVKAVRDKVLDLLKVLKMFPLPRATLKDYMNSRYKEAKTVVVNYCCSWKEIFFRLMTKDNQRMAFQLAIGNTPSCSLAMGSGRADKKRLQNLL